MAIFRHYIFLLFFGCISLAPYSQTEGLKNALGSLNKAESKSDSTLQSTKQETKVTGAISPADTLSNPQEANTTGTITFEVDSSIVNLEKGKRGFKEVKGYRIQLTIGGAEAVKKERNTYLSLGLPYSAYLKQIVPEYALQIGDFETRMQMEKHLEIIKQHYPKAFPVVEVIEPPKFGKR